MDIKSLSRTLERREDRHHGIGTIPRSGFPLRLIRWDALCWLLCVPFLLESTNVVAQENLQRLNQLVQQNEKQAPQKKQQKKAEQKKANPAQLQADLKKMKQAWQGLQKLFAPLQPLQVKQPPDLQKAEKEQLLNDSHAPVTTAVTNLWKRTLRRLAQQDWQQSYELLRHILSQPEDHLAHSSNGTLSSIRLLALQELANLPEEYLKDYRQQYRLLAKSEYETAVKESRPALFYEVATRFLPLEAGQEAANWLGMYYFDHGRFGLAAYWFQLVRGQNAVLTRSFTWKSKLLLALTASNQKRRSRELLLEINQEFPNEGPKLEQLLERWRQTIVANGAAVQPPQEDWAVAFGNAGRNGISKGGDPLLMPRWNYPLTSNRQIQNRISHLVEDFADSDLLTFLPGAPLFVDGKVILKTLRGLTVLDAESGELLWETIEQHAPEQLMGALQKNGGVIRDQFGRAFRFEREGSVESHPLAKILFQNGTYSSLSSDGSRVFVLEDLATFGGPESERGRFRNGRFVDQFHRDWSTNKLAAYDLHSGRLHWSVGGTEASDSFTQALSGYFFHGTPVSYLGQLLVIAEKQGEIQLLALAPQTGALLWKQLVAYADSDISVDFMRRYCGGQVSVADGVIVCSTAAGWVVAIDATTHAVLWSQRYASDYLRNSGQARNWRTMHDAGLELENWKAGPPLIQNNCVVFAPTEGESLNCYDLQTGRKLWGGVYRTEESHRIDARRNEALFVAGVWSDLVLVVEYSHLVAYRLTSGKEVWRLSFGEELGGPAGSGVMNSENYYLPFESGQVVKVDLKTGRMQEAFFLGGDEGTKTFQLGNLAMYRGMLLSFGWEGLQNFEQREHFDELIKKRKSDNPQDALAYLHEAEISLLDKKYLQALEQLRSVELTSLSAELKPKFLDVLRKVFRTEQKYEADDLEWGLAQLEEANVSSVDHLLTQQLRISNDLLQNDYLSAFQKSCALIPFVQTHAEMFIKQGEKWGNQVQVGAWLGGELESIWRAAKEQGQAEELNAEVENLFSELDLNDTRQVMFLTEMFDFHPAAVALKGELATRFADTENWHYSERIWRDLQRKPDEKIQNDARNSLVFLLRQRGENADAKYYELLGREGDGGKESNGKAVRPAQNRPHPLVVSTQENPVRANWELEEKSSNTEPNAYAIQLQKLGVRYSSYGDHLGKGNKLRESELPSFRRHYVEMNRKDRLSFIDANSDELVWTVPLRGNARNEYGTENYLTTVQHLMVVLNQEVLSVLSPFDRKVLWTYRLKVNGVNDLYHHYFVEHEREPLTSGVQTLERYRMQNRRDELGMLAFVNSGTIGVYGRRRLDVLDTLTGQVRWSLTNLPRDTFVIGNREVVYVLKDEETEKQSQLQAFTTREGRPVEVNSELVRQSIFVSEHHFVTLKLESKKVTENPKADNIPAQNKTKHTHVLQAVDPLSGQEAWSHQFSSKTRFGFVSEGVLAALDEEGVLQEIDLRQGSRFFYPALTSEQNKSVEQPYVLADEGHFYLLANNGKGKRSPYSHTLGELQTIPTHGSVYCFDRLTGTLKWDKEILGGQELVVDSIYRSPWLVFATGVEPGGEFYHQILKLNVLDRQTGQERFNTSLAIFDNLEQFLVHAEQKSVELRSGSQRLQLKMVPKKSSDSKSQKKPAAEK